MMNSESQRSRLPNGPAAAAMLACGVGICLFGVLVVLGEARPGLAGALNLIDSVGPLSGKVVVAIIIWLVTWAILHKVWGRSQVGFRKISWVAFALIIAGFALTFPPIFRLFEG
jgi:fumarate reductase subunit D